MHHDEHVDQQVEFINMTSVATIYSKNKMPTFKTEVGLP